MKRTLTSAAVLTAILLAINTVAFAATPQANDITAQFTNSGLSIDALQVYEIGGIVIIRGRAADQVMAEQAAVVATSLGYQRVANLVRVITPIDDQAIERRAEQELSIHRSLDGCRFHVSSQQGVVSVNGSVQHELQKDVASQLLHGIDGVREVRLDLQRF
ncbi:MAG TPA: BON domain-containing protein [Thermoanaerobaculia bacterium]|nr:BON domain-containing protein [Thermoanaerobaculia bacterium]